MSKPPRFEPKPEEPRPRGLRFTIGQLMIVIAATAGVLSVPQMLNSPLRHVPFAAAGILMALIVGGLIIDTVLGMSCPICSRRALRRLVRHRNYYRCAACRARLKRSTFGRWCDASGPEDADRFRRQSGDWKGYEPPDEPDDSTGGVLRESKRSLDHAAEARRRHPPATEGRRLEAAQRRVRKFLESRHGMDE